MLYVKDIFKTLLEAEIYAFRLPYENISTDNKLTLLAKYQPSGFDQNRDTTEINSSIANLMMFKQEIEEAIRNRCLDCSVESLDRCNQSLNYQKISVVISRPSAILHTQTCPYRARVTIPGFLFAPRRSSHALQAQATVQPSGLSPVITVMHIHNTAAYPTRWPMCSCTSSLVQRTEHPLFPSSRYANENKCRYGS